MATQKTRSVNRTTEWSSKKRYKVNDSENYNGNVYLNVTGFNSEPGVGNDWVILTTDISGKLSKVETLAAQRRFYAVNTDGIQTVVNESDIAGGGGTSKKTQIIEFAWTGGGYGANANWWRLTPFIGKYATSFQNSGLVPTDSFAGDTNFCFRETLMFDGKIKAITVEGDNNGVTWTCDFALVNFNLATGYNAGSAGSGVTNRQIVARKQFSVGTGSAQTRTFWTILTDFGDILLPKDSVIKPYFKSQGVANSNWQNVVMKILIEEV